jgi:hypothetical protein
MTLIETKTLGTAAASIEFTSIPQDATDLLVTMSVRSTRNVGNVSDVYMAFNGISTGYSVRRLYGDGSTTGSDTGGGVTNRFYLFDTSQATMTANTFGNASVYIPNYTAAVNKSISVDSVGENNATLSVQYLTAGLWSNTAAITSVLFTIASGFNFAADSSISLYKITRGTSNGVVVS